MAKLNLAAQVKQAFTDTASFDVHPMQNADDEDKVNYLKVLSLIIYADSSRVAGETAYFGALYRTLNPADTTLKSLFAFAENPDFSNIQQMATTLRAQDETGITFLLDAAMLVASDSDIGDAELALIGAYQGFLGWDNTTYNRWYSYCAAIVSGDVDDNLTKITRRCTDHILQYRKLKRDAPPANESQWCTNPVPDSLDAEDNGVEQRPQQCLLAATGASVALKVKAALEKISVLSTHPLKDADLEDKMNYLKALSLVLAADDKIVAAEEAYFGAVTRTLVDAGMVPVLLEYANNPDLSEVVAMVATMAKNEDYKYSLLLDAAMLAYADGELHQDEDELISQLQDVVGWDSEKFTQEYRLAKAISTVSEGALLNSLIFAVPKGLATHLLQYHGVVASPPLDIEAIEFEQIESMTHGRVVNASVISKKQITMEQFFPFLQYICYMNGSEIAEDILQTSSSMQLVSCSSNGLSITDRQLSLCDKYVNRPIGQVSPFAAHAFCEWLSRGSGGNYAIPRVEEGVAGNVSSFHSFGFVMFDCRQCTYQRGAMYSEFCPKENMPIAENKVNSLADLFIVNCDKCKE